MKILYRISQLPHQRVFEKLQPISGVDQIIVGPEEKKGDIPNYGYKDFGIKNIITHKGIDELAQIILDLKPDVYVDSVLSFFKKKKIFNSIPKKCRLAYIHHGFCAKTSVDTFRLHDKVYHRDWMRKANILSVACGGIEYFNDWMKELGVSKETIVLNAVPQVDLLWNSDYYNSRKSIIFNSLGAQEKRSILYFGRIGGPGKEFDDTNKEFFDVLFELEKFVSDRNMFLFVKPKVRSDGLVRFLKNNMPLEYKKIYPKLLKVMNSKRVHFIEDDGHPYQYFFSDVVVVNGGSSVELEAVVAKRPLIKVNTIINKYCCDLYDIASNKACLVANDVKKIPFLIDTLFGNQQVKEKLSNGRDKVMSRYNIIFDGKHHSRAQDAIIGL